MVPCAPATKLRPFRLPEDHLVYFVSDVVLEYPWDSAATRTASAPAIPRCCAATDGRASLSSAAQKRNCESRFLGEPVLGPGTRLRAGRLGRNLLPAPPWSAAFVCRGRLQRCLESACDLSEFDADSIADLF